MTEFSAKMTITGLRALAVRKSSGDDGVAPSIIPQRDTGPKNGLQDSGLSS
jgi:hypothetical protein